MTEYWDVKFTKREILSSLGLYAMIVGLIAIVYFTGRMLGIPEFCGM